MRPQDLLRLRTSWVVPGERWCADGALASRLQARDIEPRKTRTLLEACVARRGSVSGGSPTRNVRITVEPGRPAPLLMRLMRKKTSLEAGARARVVIREAREARPVRERSTAELDAARAERLTVVAQNPLRGILPVRQVWGMAAARGVKVEEAVAASKVGEASTASRAGAPC